jgi:hypothetical protein
MKQKLEAGDTDTAMKLAEKAMALRPRNEEVQTTLLHFRRGTRIGPARAQPCQGAEGRQRPA